MRVLRAGAAGAIGQQLLPQLVAQGPPGDGVYPEPSQGGALRELARSRWCWTAGRMAVGEAVARPSRRPWSTR